METYKEAKIRSPEEVFKTVPENKQKAENMIGQAWSMMSIMQRIGMFECDNDIAPKEWSELTKAELTPIVERFLIKVYGRKDPPFKPESKEEREGTSRFRSWFKKLLG